MAIRVTAMRSVRPRLRPFRFACAVALGGLVLCHASVLAAPARRVEVAVEQDSEVFARMRGQTADLAVELVAVGHHWQHDDALRVWFEADANNQPREVVVSDPAAGRELRRAVAAGTVGGLAGSARAEAIALVVRSGLLELLAASSETATPDAAPSPAPVAAPTKRGPLRTEDDGADRDDAQGDSTASEPARDDVVLDEQAESSANEHAKSEPAASAERVEVVEPIELAEAEPPSARDDFAFTLRPGMQAAWDGSGGRPHLAPEVALGLRLGRLSLAAVGGYGLPLESSDATSVVELRRHHAVLEASYVVRESSATSIELALRAGAYVLPRKTRVRDADYVATADHTTYSSLLSARVRLLVALVGWRTAGHALRLGVEAGVDVVSGAPNLSYRQPDRVVDRDALWLAQPVLTLALEYAVWL